MQVYWTDLGRLSLFKDFLNSSCTVTRTSTVKDATTHIASKSTSTLGPYLCRIGRASGNVVQAQPQAGYTQSLRLYTLIDADIKAGDIITVDSIKYTVGNVYKCNGHHIEADITFKSEV